MPGEKQVEIAEDILERDMSVRRTEDRVQQEKKKLAEERRLKEALKRAKRPKCPACGAEPEGFAYDNENKFRCSKIGCWGKWEFMKIQKEVDQERQAREKQEKEERVKQLRKSRENPRWIRHLSSQEEIDDLINGYLVRHLDKIVKIDKIELEGSSEDGKRINISWDPEGKVHGFIFEVGGTGGYSWKDENWQPADIRFSMFYEAKDYKKLEEKTRIDSSLMPPCDENRALLRRFIDEILLTDQDPPKWLKSEEEETEGE